MTRAQIALSLVGGLVGLAVAFALFLRLGSGQGTSQLRGYQILSDRAVRVELEVARSPGSEAFCVVRARDRTGAEVGRSTFAVPPSDERTTVVGHEFATTARPIGGELVGCEAGRPPSAP